MNDRTFKLILLSSVLGCTLGVWKAVEIILWLVKHISISFV